MNNDALESKALNLLKHGYMPTDNKNLITFSALTSLVFLVGMAAYTTGYSIGSEQMYKQMQIAHELQVGDGQPPILDHSPLLH